MPSSSSSSFYVSQRTPLFLEKPFCHHSSGLGEAVNHSIQPLTTELGKRSWLSYQSTWSFLDISNWSREDIRPKQDQSQSSPWFTTWILQEKDSLFFWMLSYKVLGVRMPQLILPCFISLDLLGQRSPAEYISFPSIQIFSFTDWFYG